MWARIRTAVRERPIAGFGVSVLVHLGLAALILFVAAPKPVYVTRRGEPLFVELPNLEGAAPRGNPAARTPGPPTPSEPAAPPRGDRARPALKPAPRATARAEAPARPAASKPSLPQPKASPSPTPSKPSAEPEKLARAPAPSAPKPEPPTPSAPEPAPRAAEPAPKSAETERRPEAPKVAESPRAPAESAPAGPQGGASSQGRQTAMVPPAAPGSRDGRDGSGVDIRSAFKRGGGGAGGAADGRGGIEGEPIPLETKDPRYSDYLDRVRRMIKEKWGYPCVRESGRECEYKTAQLVIEFGIAKDGKVPFVNVRHSTGYDIMDEYAVRAVKLASPFPPVPDSLSRKGIPILATFNYIVDTSLVNLLR